MNWKYGPGRPARRSEKAKMNLTEEQSQKLVDIGTQLLNALHTIARTAEAELSRRPVNAEITVSGGGEQALKNLQTIRTQVHWHLQRMTREPFVARVAVQWQDADPDSNLTLYYISRASVAGLSNVLPDAQLATYTAPLGRLAEYEPGEFVTVPVRGRLQDARIVERTLVRPEQRDFKWDALEATFEFTSWRAALDSVRRFLAEIGAAPPKLLEEPDLLSPLLREAAALDLVRQSSRRRVIDQIALRDQPILDRYQGEVFRMPLDRQLFLFGPPGTGKTTTLIRRLAQKRTPGALTEDEEALLSGELREAFARSDSWAMFSPTELLKLYLHDAFNREGVPASDANNLRTWERERLDLGRNALGILRSASSGRFQLDDQSRILADPSSAAVSRFYTEVAAEVEATVLRQCNDALQKLEKSEDASIRNAVGSLRRALGTADQLSLREINMLVDAARDLQPEIRRLEDEIEDEIKRAVNRLIVDHSGVLDEVADLLGRLQSDEDGEAEDIEEESETDLQHTREGMSQAQIARLIMSAVRAAARRVAESRPPRGGRTGRIVELLGARLPKKEELAKVGERIITRGQLRTLTRAPRELVLGVPRIYARFRQQSAKGGRFFRSEVEGLIRSNIISPDELDVLILVMLSNSRRLLQYGNGERLRNRTNQDWLETIKSRYLIQVFVDEATDFSAVQLACMLELAHPTLRSWFACGDLRQRVTTNGLGNTSELDWLGSIIGAPIEVRKVTISYRQSRRLRELATALATLDGGLESQAESPSGVEENDISPVLGEGLADDSLAAWLAGRICEVERAIGRLPSIAVFVDGDNVIDSLVARTQRYLAPHNIRIVGCKEGRVVGDRLEVRVFDVHHIKGLEFEAVFFVSIDRLAEHLPDIFHRFLYVGVTRAATYLGVTCEGVLPRPLEQVRRHFRTDGWQR